MSKLLSYIDQFGVEDKLQIHPLMPVQRTVTGGLVTIILYGLSLGYFLSEFIDWVNNNKLPKFTSYQRQIEVGEVVTLEGRFLDISSYQLQDGSIDPFDPENLIFFPIVQKIPGDWTKIELIPIQFEIATLPNQKKTSHFYLENKQLKGSPPNSGSNDFTEYQIIFQMCNTSFLLDGQKCANEKVITQFNQQDNYVQILVFISQYDQKNKQLYRIPKSTIINLSLDSVQYCSYELEVAKLQADDGMLFSNLNNFKYVSDFSFSMIQADHNYSKKEFGVQSFLVTYFSMGQIKLEVLVEFPKISEILADTGSIITWILQISFLVSRKTIKEIIKMYFPDFEELILTKNLLGQITVASIKEKKYDPKKVSQLLGQISDMAKSKVSFINLQYEVSRLQLILTEALGIKYMKQHLGSQNKIKDLLDSLEHNASNQENSNSKSLLQILPSKQLEDESIDQQQFQNSADQDIIKIEGFDKIDSTMALLMKIREREYDSTENEKEKKIFIQKEVKVLSHNEN